MINVAIAILNWNGVDYLKKFLPSVIKYSLVDGVKIYIIDNASTDSSIEYIKKNYKNIYLIELDKNYGFAKGYNIGLSKIKANYFLLLNSDVEATKDWLIPLIDLLENDKKIVACQPKILSYADKEKFEYAGAAGGYIDKFGYPFCQGRIFNINETDEGQYNEKKSIFWATGACILIKANIFHEAGGFDNSFFAHMEEIDLCWRLKNIGYKIYYVPDSIIYHLGGGTLPKTNPKKTFLNFRNNYFLLYKNLRFFPFLKIYFARILFDFGSFLLFISEFKLKDAIAIIKAHIAFWFSIKKLTKAKRIFSQRIKNRKHAEIYKKSIVIDFYYKKVRSFKNLEFNIKSYK